MIGQVRSLIFSHYSLCPTTNPCCVKRVSVYPNSLCNQLRHTDKCCWYACVICACFSDRSGASDCRECSLSLIFGTRGLPLARDVFYAYSGRGGKSRACARDLEFKVAKHSTLETSSRLRVESLHLLIPLHHLILALVASLELLARMS